MLILINPRFETKPMVSSPSLDNNSIMPVNLPGLWSSSLLKKAACNSSLGQSFLSRVVEIHREDPIVDFRWLSCAEHLFLLNANKVSLTKEKQKTRQTSGGSTTSDSHFGLDRLGAYQKPCQPLSGIVGMGWGHMCMMSPFPWTSMIVFFKLIVLAYESWAIVLCD